MVADKRTQWASNLMRVTWYAMNGPFKHYSCMVKRLLVSRLCSMGLIWYEVCLDNMLKNRQQFEGALLLDL